MATSSTLVLPTDWRDFYALTKPRVMSLVIFTGVCGLLAARQAIDPILGFTAIFCIAIGAGGAAALNQWWEADLDAGKVTVVDCGVWRPDLPAGGLAALILAVSILYYAVVYTIWLKPRTPQNIVIGGGAGAFPPMIGWVAATGHITLMPVLLFAIIFLWTPPHFWALGFQSVLVDQPTVEDTISILRGLRERYELHHGVRIRDTALVAAAVLSTLFVAYAIPVGLRRQKGEGDAMTPERRMFKFSILYLFLLFGALVADRWSPIAGF